MLDLVLHISRCFVVRQERAVFVCVGKEFKYSLYIDPVRSFVYRGLSSDFPSLLIHLTFV